METKGWKLTVEEEGFLSARSVLLLNIAKSGGEEGEKGTLKKKKGVMKPFVIVVVNRESLLCVRARLINC
jgi:hypothetical protein